MLNVISTTISAIVTYASIGTLVTVVPQTNIRVISEPDIFFDPLDVASGGQSPPATVNSVYIISRCGGEACSLGGDDDSADRGE